MRPNFNALLFALAACGDNIEPTADAGHITVMLDDARPDALPCDVAGANVCCTELPDRARAAACFAAELPAGTCGVLVCSCGVVVACHVHPDAGVQPDAAGDGG